MRDIFVFFLVISLLFTSLPLFAADEDKDEATVCVQKQASIGGVIKFPILTEDLSTFTAVGFTEFECPSKAEVKTAFKVIKDRCTRFNKHSKTASDAMKKVFGISSKTMCKAVKNWLDEKETEGWS